MARITERPIVAELGRPETPEEEAARKRARSIAYRESKTLHNLLIALTVTVGLVAVMFFIVPRTDTNLVQAVDYTQVAAGAQSSMPIPLAAPVLPAGWSSNSAQLRTGTTDKVIAWYIGLITPSTQYVGITQGLDANPSWLADQVAKGLASDVIVIDGVTWTIYDNRTTTTDVGNVKYALTTQAGRATYVVFGTASPQEISTAAASLTDNIRQQTSTSTGSTP